MKNVALTAVASGRYLSTIVLMVVAAFTALSTLAQ